MSCSKVETEIVEIEIPCQSCTPNSYWSFAEDGYVVLAKCRIPVDSGELEDWDILERIENEEDGYELV